MENCYRIKPSFLWITFESGVKNLFIGMVHSYFYENNRVQLILLMLIHLISIGSILYFWIKPGIYRKEMYVSGVLLNNCLFFLFEFSLYLNSGLEMTEEIKEVFDTVHITVVFVIFFCAIAVNSLCVICEHKFPEER